MYYDRSFALVNDYAQRLPFCSSRRNLRWEITYINFSLPFLPFLPHGKRKIGKNVFNHSRQIRSLFDFLLAFCFLKVVSCLWRRAPDFYYYASNIRRKCSWLEPPMDLSWVKVVSDKDVPGITKGTQPDRHVPFWEPFSAGESNIAQFPFTVCNFKSL